MKKKKINFLRENKQYFWDCTIDNLSDQAILERLINYADIYEIRKFIGIVWFLQAKKTFIKILSQQRINILSIKLLHYFYLFFGLKDEIPYWDIIQRAKKSIFFHKTV